MFGFLRKKKKVKQPKRHSFVKPEWLATLGGFVPINTVSIRQVKVIVFLN